MYLERVELFFVANNVEDRKQVATLLSVIGSRTYALLSDLLAPRRKLLSSSQRPCRPKPVVIVERFQFHRRNQEAGESVAEYEAELRRLTTNCKFGNHLTQAIRDRLVCGLRIEGTQKRLLWPKLSKSLRVWRRLTAIHSASKAVLNRNE